MVKAIGTDIVATARIEAALERSGRKFAQRILTELEMAQFDVASQPAAFLAKRFAAKKYHGQYPFLRLWRRPL